MEKKRTETFNRTEKRRLRQLLVCLVLFGLVFLGRGLDLAPVEQAAATVSRWVGADTDFQAVFAQMGEAFSRGEPAAETFHALWTGLLPGKEALEESGGEKQVQEETAPLPEQTEEPAAVG